jgi:hypothetical protein
MPLVKQHPGPTFLGMYIDPASNHAKPETKHQEKQENKHIVDFDEVPSHYKKKQLWRRK